MTTRYHLLGGTGLRLSPLPLGAIDGSDIVVITVPFDRYPDIARATTNALPRKIVIDTSSQIDWRADPPEVFTVPGGLTGAQHQQDVLAPATVVKAFNYIYAEDVDRLARHVSYQRIAVLLAGDDNAAKKTVASLIKSVGFVPVDVGGLGEAHLIEARRLRKLRRGHGAGDGRRWRS